jgi:DNA mismatch repair protein MutS2
MSAREEAERALVGIREEIRAVRATLERETVTQSGLDELARRLDERLEALPAAEDGGGVAAPSDGEEPLRVGAHARATSGGWEGRIAAIDRGGEQATLEAGEMRVIVPLADLVPTPAPTAAGGASQAGRGSSGRRGDFGPEVSGQGSGAEAPRRASRAPVRGVASTLDLRGARVDEALELLDQFLDQAVVAGLPQVTVVHGHGTGALRDAVRSALREHAEVREWRPGERGEGGDGASIVLL